VNADAFCAGESKRVMTPNKWLVQQNVSSRFVRVCPVRPMRIFTRKVQLLSATRTCEVGRS